MNYELNNCKYLSRNYKGLGSAGNKAKTDIEKIMDSMGLGNAGLRQTTYNNKLAHFFLTLAGVIKSPFSLKRGDTLLLQYPLKKYFTLVCRMAHMRGARVVVIIHDLGSFRRKALTPEKEICRLNHADYIIAHNDSMKQWLESHGCRAMVGTLGIFDYLSDTQAAKNNSSEDMRTIVYAGALSHRKNTFLYRWGEHISSFKVRLYGNGFEIGKAKGADKFELMGFVKSDELIATARGHFGLVWDGASEDGMHGRLGRISQDKQSAQDVALSALLAARDNMEAGRPGAVCQQARHRSVRRLAERARHHSAQHHTGTVCLHEDERRAHRQPHSPGPLLQNCL